MGEWTQDEIQRIGYQVVDLIAEHISRLPDEPVFRPVPPHLQDRFQSTPPPAAAVAPDEILREFCETIEPFPFGNGHPRFWAWVNSPPAIMGIFADALAAAMNPSCAGGNHAAIWLERQVTGWFREILGLPQNAKGLLVSGGSMATLTALGVARHVMAGTDVRRLGLRNAEQPFGFYLSSESHGCVRKAIELLGFGSSAIRTIPNDRDYCMNVEALDEALASDRGQRVTPIAVIASAGTTNTGAIDDLDGIAGVCRRHGVWLHIDAAYGGPAVLTDEYRHRLGALGSADSVALDPHKWLFVPVEAGLVFVRDADAMRSAFSLVPPYLRTDGSTTGVGGPPWYSEFGVQQTRGFRALKVWMTMKEFGLEGFKTAIEENLALAAYLADRVRASDDFELVATPSLSVVCFRLVGRSSSDESAIAGLNRAVLERLPLGGDAFLSSTELQGRFTLRACIVNYRSTRSDIDRMLDAIRNAAVAVG